MWVHRLGEFVEARVQRWRCQINQLPGVVVQFIGADDSIIVAPSQIALAQPQDCGRMVPPCGSAGIRIWLLRDPTVFATRWPVGAFGDPWVSNF